MQIVQKNKQKQNTKGVFNFICYFKTGLSTIPLAWTRHVKNKMAQIMTYMTIQLVSLYIRHFDCL